MWGRIKPPFYFYYIYDRLFQGLYSYNCSSGVLHLVLIISLYLDAIEEISDVNLKCKVQFTVFSNYLLIRYCMM